MSLPQKVGHKARHGRHRSRPEPHRAHRKPAAYSRVGRLLKASVREALAPRVSDFEHDLRPFASGVHVAPTNRASAVVAASPMTHQEVPR